MRTDTFQSRQHVVKKWGLKVKQDVIKYCLWRSGSSEKMNYMLLEMLTSKFVEVQNVISGVSLDWIRDSCQPWLKRIFYSRLDTLGRFWEALLFDDDVTYCCQYWKYFQTCGVLSFDTQVRGFKPDRSRWIFQEEKILSTPSFGGEVKPSVLCCRFKACKRSLNVTWKPGIFRQNSSAISRPCSSIFGC